MAYVLLLLLLLSQQPLALINGERASTGVNSLVPDACLYQLANSRAQDMLSRGYFSHTTPDGRLPWDQMRMIGCPFTYAAENIAEAPDAIHAVSELWSSAEHRRNTLDARYHKIGIGSVTRSDGTQIFVEDFTD